MKKCAEVKRMLSRYLDKEVNNADKAMVEVHLAGCLPCREELSELIRIKGFVSKAKRRTLPQDYLISRLREAIACAQYAKKKLSLTGMGSFARKLIPVPVAAIIASMAFLMLTSTQAVTKTSIEDHIFSGSAATTETALELILGTQN